MRILAYFFLGISGQVWKPTFIAEEEIAVLQLDNPSEKVSFYEAKKTCDKYGGKLPVPKNPLVNEGFDSKFAENSGK